MRAQLTDIVRQVGSLFECIKITGTPTETRVDACDKSKSLLLVGAMKEPVTEFAGEFGIGDLGVLNGFLNFPSYKTDDAKLLAHQHPHAGYISEFEFRDAQGAGAHFKTKNPRLVDNQSRVGNIPWAVTFTLSKAKIGEFSQLVSTLSDVKKFGVVLVNGTLFFTIGGGGEGTHAASVAVATDIDAEYPSKSRYMFDSVHFLAILKSAGNNPAVVRFASMGLCQVSVETAQGTYDYFLRAIEI